MTTPALKNRKRDERDSSNAVTDIKVGSRLHLILAALERYPYLDINFLMYLTGLSEDNLEVPLRQAFDSALIDRLQNKKFDRDRFTDPQVYGRNPNGSDWLLRKGLKPPSTTWVTAGGTPAHNLKACLFTANIDVAFLRAGYQTEVWEELLRGAPEKTKRLKSPWRFTIDEDHHLVPDGILSAIRKDDLRRCNFIEIDLSDHGQFNYEAKAALYDRLIFGGIYKKHLGIEQWASVLTMTTSLSRFETMMRVTDKSSPALFKYMPSWGPYDKAPRPDPAILDGWFSPKNPTRPVNLLDVF